VKTETVYPPNPPDDLAQALSRHLILCGVELHWYRIQELAEVARTVPDGMMFRDYRTMLPSSLIASYDDYVADVRKMLEHQLWNDCREADVSPIAKVKFHEWDEPDSHCHVIRAEVEVRRLNG
jgi:hypothetical protein